MKKIKRILAGVLTYLSFTGGTRALEKDKIQNSKVIDSKSLNLSSKNQFSNFLKNNKGKIIGITAGAAALGTIYGLGREGVYNALFPGSHKSLYYRDYTDVQIDYAEQKAIKNGLKHIEFKTDFGILRGFACVPENINNEDIKKIVLVFGGNGHLACHAVNSAQSRSAKKDKENTIFVCFDYPTYGKSEGPTLSQKVMQKYAKYCLDYAKKIKERYKNAEISTYGFSLGGYPASYLSKEKDVKEVKLWSPIQWDAAVQGLTGLRGLGVFGRILGFFGSNFDSIENIKNSHENCKINLFSGSRAEGDFLSLETTVFKGEEYEGQITDIKYLKDGILNVRVDNSFENHCKREGIKKQACDEKEMKVIKNIKAWEQKVAQEVFKKLAKEGKNNLGERLTVSFLAEADHCDEAFNDKVWSLESTCKNK